MIKKLAIRNFKGFKEYEIDFMNICLLVGGNNSGKTTIFHAMQILFWCIDQTSVLENDEVTFRKTQVPEIGAIPYFSLKDLFYKQKLREGRSPARINLVLTTSNNIEINFDIYPVF